MSVVKDDDFSKIFKPIAPTASYRLDESINVLLPLSAQSWSHGDKP